MAGNAPSVWWTQDALGGDNISAQLAMLSWVPNPAPKALERTEFLKDTVDERWGTVCHDAAPAASVLYTFCDEVLGPSAVGWHPKGTPWPDPVDTVRSEPVDTSLHVFETWRTGETQLDRRRGIIPAVIEGGKVPCIDDLLPPDNDDDDVDTGGGFTGPDILGTRPLVPDVEIFTRPNGGFTIPDAVLDDAFRPTRGLETRDFSTDLRVNRDVLRSVTRPNDLSSTAIDRLRVETDRLSAATAGSFGDRIIDNLDAPTLAIDEAVRRVTFGKAVSRTSILSAVRGLQPTANDNSVATTGTTANLPDDILKCDGRVLASPLWDIGKPVVFGNPQAADDIQGELDLLGHKHGPLSDVIRIDKGEIVDGVLFMWVNRALLNKESGDGRGMMVQYRDAEGNLLGDRPVRVTDLTNVTPLPDRWFDVNGPWISDVYHAVFYGQLYLKNRVAVVVHMKPPEGTALIDVGVLYNSLQEAEHMEQQGRPFYISAIELTTLREAQRSSYDQTQIMRERSVLEDFVGPMSANVALLHPGKTYRVTAVTNVQVREGNEAPQDGGQQSETFWFRTDDDAPRRLDPWILMSTPSEEEEHVFGHEKLEIVFATNSMDQLYAAYGKELRARLKAASFRQVDDPATPHPLPITPATLDNVEASVLSPFEAVLVDVLKDKAPCVPVDEQRVRHGTFILPIPLDPYTDYILDIEAVDIGAEASAVGERVFRRAFSTGAFLTVESFAHTFAATRAEHRAVTLGAMQGFAAKFSASNPPLGADFDDAMVDAGLEPLERPDAPRFVVYWEQANPAATPQPVAVMIDSSEPMRRFRPMPEEVTSDDSVPVQRYQMIDREWLALDESASGDGIVDEMIFAPGDQRVLITLDPGARGKVLHIDLVRRAFSEAHLDGPGATDDVYRIVSQLLARAPWEE